MIHGHDDCNVVSSVSCSLLTDISTSLYGYLRCVFFFFLVISEFMEKEGLN